MVYELKQYDKTLIEFEIVSKYLEGMECGILSVNKDSEYLLPYGLTVSGEGILSWLKHRVLPRNREYAKTRFPACCNVTFEDLIKGFMSDRQIEKLRKMQNFKFIRHSKYNLPLARLEKIEKHLQRRVEEFITILPIGHMIKSFLLIQLCI